MVFTELFFRFRWRIPLDGREKWESKKSFFIFLLSLSPPPPHQTLAVPDEGVRLFLRLGFVGKGEEIRLFWGESVRYGT